MNAPPQRYEQKPILILIENYVLAVIGELDPVKAVGVRDAVKAVWGGGDDWQATLRAQLAWEPSMDDTIQRNWQGYRKAARAQGAAGSAEEFAMMFADAVEKEAESS